MTQRSWLYILVGLLISSFLGGAVLVFFSPERIRNYVESNLSEKQPKFDIEFESAHLRLASSWWPTVAIELRGLYIKAKDRCITNSTVRSNYLVIPLHWRMLFSPQIRLGSVQAGNVQLTLQPSNCSSPQPDTSPTTDGVAPLERFFQKRWSKEVVNTTKILEEFRVESLEVLRPESTTPPATIENLRIRFLPKASESEMQFTVRWGEPWVGKAAFGPLIFTMHIRPDEVQLKGHGNLKEGQYQIESQWAVDRGEIRLRVTSQDVPAQSLLNLAQHWSLFQLKAPTIKNQWMTCDFTMEGSIRNFSKLPISLHQCRLYGDLGEIQVKTQNIKNLREGGSLELLVEDLEVKRLLSTLGLEKSWGFVSQFGHFTGDILIRYPSELEMSGYIRKSELYLTNHARQKLHSHHVHLLANSERISGEWDDFILPEGTLLGKATVNRPRQGQTQFNIEFSKIQLPISMQKILWGGLVPEFSLVAHVEAEDSLPPLIRGELKMKDWQTMAWELKGVAVEFRNRNEDWLLRGKAERFELRPESKWSPFINTLQTAIEPRPKETFLRSLAFDAIWREHEGEWSQFQATDSDRRLQYFSAGGWTEKGQLHGSIVAKSLATHLPSKPKMMEKSWILLGDWRIPKVSETP